MEAVVGMAFLAVAVAVVVVLTLKVRGVIFGSQRLGRDGRGWQGENGRKGAQHSSGIAAGIDENCVLHALVVDQRPAPPVITCVWPIPLSPHPSPKALLFLTLLLLARQGANPAALMQRRGGDMTSALSGVGAAFDRSAAQLEASAEHRMKLAKEERAAKGLLTEAQV